ncbi:MAG: regulatory protein RecX, partial [Trueperaceae bacterium]
MSQRRLAGGQPKPLTKERAWNYLLYILARRSYTVAELREKLLRRGLPAAEAEPLLQRLHELRLVDDSTFAEQYVSSRKRARGRLVLRRELQRKGV